MFLGNTLHYQNDRRLRQEFIDYVIGGFGLELYRGYTKNKDITWRSEVHIIYSRGIIVIVNPFRGMERIVTTKIARPAQIRQVCAYPYFVSIKNGAVIVDRNKKYSPQEILKKRTAFYEMNKWNKDLLPPREEWDFYRDKLNREDFT